MSILVAIVHIAAGAWLFRTARRGWDLLDELAMAQHVIDELAPKAEAWDRYLDGRRMQRPGLTAQAAAARESDFRVPYQNLCAECSDAE